MEQTTTLSNTRKNYTSKENAHILKITAIVLYMISLIPLLNGFYKLYAYHNVALENKINAYVNGDAYNFIINANLTTAWFMIFGIITICATLLLAASLIITAQTEK